MLCCCASCGWSVRSGWPKTSPALTLVSIYMIFSRYVATHLSLAQLAERETVVFTAISRSSVRLREGRFFVSILVWVKAWPFFFGAFLVGWFLVGFWFWFRFWFWFWFWLKKREQKAKKREKKGGAGGTPRFQAVLHNTATSTQKKPIEG
jgi:predicted membrane protein